MQISLIRRCVQDYRGKLAPQEESRLQFLSGLWEVMAEAQSAYVPQQPPLGVDDAVLGDAYRHGTPLFQVAPPPVAPEAFERCAAAIASYLAGNGGYDQQTASVLPAVRWADYLAGDQASVQECSLAPAVAALALFLFYEQPALDLLARVACDESAASSEAPLTCPVCGSAPSLASVGTPTTSDGRGRKLYCTACGTGWEFERVRCARCGTTDQTKLHYLSLEGDADHRLAVCDSCNGTMRTTFADNALSMFSPLVEDAVMVPLEALARNRTA